MVVHHCLPQDMKEVYFFPFLVYTETFAPSLHLSSLLEADQEYGIIILGHIRSAQ